MHPTLAIGAILLAAGSSRRFGTSNKLLVEIEGRPLVRRVAEAIEAGGIDRIVVVTGHQADVIAAAVAGVGRRITYNERHELGLGASIACGLRAIDDDIDGVLIVQGDMPALTSEQVAALCGRFAAAGGTAIVHPVLSDGRQGNPVLWPRRLFSELRKLSSDEGGKRLLATEGAAVVRIPALGEGAGIDIDTPEDLEDYARSSQPR